MYFLFFWFFVLKSKKIGNCLKTIRANRNDLFITTKLHPVDHGTQSSVSALQSSLRNLQTSHIDLLLFHYAECWGDVCAGDASSGDWRDSWRALTPFVRNGTVRALGVSNFHMPQLRELLALIDSERLSPLVVVQDWMDPFHQARDKRAFCVKHNITFQAYSPLGGQYWQIKPNPVINDATLTDIGKSRSFNAAQTTLQWMKQMNVVLIL